MKVHKLFIYLLIAGSFFMLSACGGGGGSAGTGELAIDITDAKPLLPEGATNLWVEIAEVLVHGQGGWESLPLPQTPSPYIIDLLQFWGGATTELVPPVMLTSGKYTQIRLVLAEDGAWIRFHDDDEQKYPVVIPSENLKTDKNIDFDVPDGGSVDLMIDFDLSQSLVVTNDGSGTLSYKCKPVVHVVDTFEAATISGTIADGSFGTNTTANITVLANGEVYTEVTVDRDSPNDVGFTIFWLVPNKDYRVEIDFDYDPESTINSPEWCENVNSTDLQPGDDFVLNGTAGAITPPLDCPS
jgi:hypothetical protein